EIYARDRACGTLAKNHARKAPEVQVARWRHDKTMAAVAPSGFLPIDGSDLEYRMIGPSPDKASTIVMLHEGLGSAGLWGDFPDKLQDATTAGVLVYSLSVYLP